MDMLRVTARWTGFQGAPGYSNFFFAGGGGLISDAGQVANRVRSAFNELGNILPESVSIDIDPEVPVIDSDTGMTASIETIDPPGTVTGGASTAYSAASGGVVTWRTNDLRNGRRIMGRTFLVPLAAGAYESDGTLSTAGLTNLRGFADELTAGDFDSELGVWSRPVGGSGGVFATVTAYTVADKVAVLRSRRD